jgi:2-polyprenyl-3-methyl-5-hydroxy-6-metoxy-1,4-benzoquinol methylase
MIKDKDMNCPNCKSTSKLIHNKVWSIDNGSVFRCHQCDLIFINPIMTESEELDFYKNYNTHVKKRGVTLTESVEEFHQQSKIIAQERLAVVADYFKGKKVLEVGSSTGAFLSLLDDCETYACELADENREYSRQFVNGNAYASIDTVTESQFDLICMFHVFEHIREPQNFLKQCKKLLKDGGVILIEVPHSEDPLISIFDSAAYKDFIFQPMHPMVYNETSLDYVFNKAGFDKDNVIYHQRYGLDNHLSWFKNAKSGGDTNLTKLFSSILEYKNILEQMKKTDTIYYVASKK